MVAISHRARAPQDRAGTGRQTHAQARLTSAGAVCGALLLFLLVDGLLRSPGSLDYRVLDAVQSLGLSAVEPAMDATRTLIAAPWALAIWGAAVVAFALSRRWSLAVPVLLAPLFVGIATFVLGGLVSHVGPDPTELERAIADPVGSSFPSGQVVAVVLFGGLVATAALRSAVPALRFGACGAAVLAAGLIGLSELWYGAHWPTDVLAGYAYGGLVLAFTVTLERWFAPAVDGHAPRAAVRAAKGRFVDGEGKASAWLENAVARWQQEGRLTDDEAANLRTEIEAPRFQAVLPHLGVHLTIGVALRFPFGSIVRGTYVLANMVFATGRFLAHRIDRKRWRQDLSIHSPLVLLVTCLPGVGTFAYLLAKPVRSNHLLLRVVLDSVLRKAPTRLYAGTGLARAVARPAGWAATKDATSIQMPAGRDAQAGRFLSIALPAPQTVAKALGTVAVALFAADLVMQTADERFHPTFFGWSQSLRILDLNSETSLGTWLTVVGLFVASLLFGLIAYAARHNGSRYQGHWAFLALVFLGFSLDEQAKFHDPGGNAGNVWRDKIGASGLLYYGWVLLALACVIAMAFVYRRFIFALPARIRALSFLAATLYVGGEVGVEMVTGWLMDTRGDGLLYDTFTSIEEFMGLMGVVVAVGALLLYIREHVGEIRVQVGLVNDSVTGPASLAEPRFEPLVPSPSISAAVQPLLIVHEVQHEYAHH